MLLFLSGITGKVGGAAASRLLSHGHSLRALVRDPDKARAWADRGVALVQGDLSDAGALAAAMAGTDGAFLMVPPVTSPSPDFAEVRPLLASFSAALAASTPPPKKLVVLSSFGSERPERLGLITSTQLLERALAEVSAPLAFVRAGSFLDNLAPGLARAAATGVFDIFYTPTERPVPMIATVDIGAQVAELLVAPWQGRRVVELGTRVSPDEVAAAMSEALGQPIAARAVPRAHWAAVIQGFGLPAGATGPYEEMLDSINAGWIDFGAAGAERVEATTTPAQFFAQLAGAAQPC